MACLMLLNEWLAKKKKNMFASCVDFLTKECKDYRKLFAVGRG